MSLSALDSVDDAIEATKRFLVPLDRARWFRLAVVMLFVSGAGVSVPNVPTSGFGGPDVGGPDVGEPGAGPEPGAAPGPDAGAGSLAPEVTPELVALLVGLVALVVVVALLWAVAGAVMEFVFVEALRRETVRLWTPFKHHWWRGVRLFVFRAGVWLLTFGGLAAVLLAVGVAVGGWPVTAWGGGAVLALLALGIPLFLVALFVAGNLLGFTTVFVVPVMLVEERGVLSAWRRFWPTLVDGWKEYLAYMVVGFLLGVGVGIAVGFLSLLVLVVLAVPFAIVGVPLVLVLGLGGAGAAVALVFALAYVAVVFVTLLLVKVPFQTCLRYYALFVLGDTNPDFDVVPDARAAVRTDGGRDGHAVDGDTGGDDSGSGPARDDTGDGPGGDGPAGGGDAADEGWDVDRDDRS